jgi:hypothetical protein
MAATLSPAQVPGIYTKRLVVDKVVFRDLEAEMLLYPPQYKSGDIVSPYEKAKRESSRAC